MAGVGSNLAQEFATQAEKESQRAILKNTRRLMAEQQRTAFMADGGTGYAGWDQEAGAAAGLVLDEETGEMVTADERKRRRALKQAGLAAEVVSRDVSRVVRSLGADPQEVQQFDAIEQANRQAGDDARRAMAAKQEQAQQILAPYQDKDIGESVRGAVGNVASAATKSIPALQDSLNAYNRTNLAATGTGVAQTDADIVAPQTPLDIALLGVVDLGAGGVIKKGASTLNRALAATPDELLDVAKTGDTMFPRAAMAGGAPDPMEEWAYSLKKLEQAKAQGPEAFAAEMARQREIGQQKAAQYTADLKARQTTESGASVFSNTGKAEIEENVASTAQQMKDAGLRLLKDETGSIAVPDVKFGTPAQEAASLIGLPRTLKATLDLSAPGRQGLALAFRHPKEWAESWAPMLKAWKNEPNMRAVNDQLGTTMAKWNDRLTSGISDQARLLDAPLKAADDTPYIHLYKVGADAPGLERPTGFEAAGKGFIGEMVRKVPGLENSERAYATFLNTQKVKTFDTMAESLWRAGERNPEAFRNLGQVIDHATGYGAAPLKGAIEGQALFSQRYMLSRFQFLAEPMFQAVKNGDMNAARAAAENLVAYTGGIAGLMMLGKEAGIWDVEFDPRSSDFGKIRIGPQRFDFGAGFLPIIRTAARMASGEGKSVTGDVYDLAPEEEFVKFFRNKLSPLFSQGVTQLTGENAIGEEAPGLFSLENIKELFMPLIANAALETFNETGDPFKTGLTIASEMFGGGTSVYGSGQAAQADIARQRYGKEFDSLYSAQQAEINAEIEDSDTKLEWRNRQGAWWQARDDAFSYWKSQLSPEDQADPLIQFVLQQDNLAGLFPNIDSDGKLAQWIAQTYSLPRADAVKAANRVSSQTKLDDFVKAYRKQMAYSDQRYYDAWLEAFNAGETDDAPPQWLREFIEGLPKEEAASVP